MSITANSKCGNFMPIGEEAPKVWLHETDCGWDKVVLDVFGSPDLYAEADALGIYSMKDQNKIAIVPPFTELKVFDGRYFNTESGPYKPTVTLKGPVIHDFYGEDMYMSANSLQAKATRPWSDAMVPCCTGQIEGKWCGTWDPKKTNSVCDARMKEWCARPENKDRQECACINSSIKYLPSCFDTKCTNNPLAYKTKDMRDVVSAGCPSIMECNQYISLSDEAKQNVVNRTQMEQKCTSVTNNTTTGSTTNTNPTPTADSNTGDQPDSGSYGTVDNGLGSTSPYVPTEPTQPYSPPSSSPYAGTTQPDAYSNPYQPTTSSSYPYSGSSTNTTSSSDSAKIMGLEPATLMIILVVVFAFIIIIVMVSSSGSSNQYPQYPQYPQYQQYPQYPGRY